MRGLEATEPGNCAFELSLLLQPQQGCIVVTQENSLRQQSSSIVANCRTQFVLRHANGSVVLDERVSTLDVILSIRR